MLKLPVPQKSMSLPSMERQGSCPVSGSSPTSIASGALSARTHVSIRGASRHECDSRTILYRASYRNPFVASYKGSWYQCRRGIIDRGCRVTGMTRCAALPGDQPEQPEQAQDTAARQEEVTGALATPRDAAVEDRGAKNPSLIGPLRSAYILLLCPVAEFEFVACSCARPTTRIWVCLSRSSLMRPAYGSKGSSITSTTFSLGLLFASRSGAV